MLKRTAFIIEVDQIRYLKRKQGNMISPDTWDGTTDSPFKAFTFRTRERAQDIVDQLDNCIPNLYPNLKVIEASLFLFEPGLHPFGESNESLCS